MKLVLYLLLFVSFGIQANPLYCTGDSQTQVRAPLVAAPDTYCALLATVRGSAFSNIAVPSAKTSDWLATQVPQLTSATPGCVTVMIGINDGWIDPATPQPWPNGPISSTQTKTNIEAGVQAILNAGHQVTIFTSYAMWWTVNLSTIPSYIRAQKSAAIAKGVPAIDAYAIAANCWLQVAGSAQYQTCVTRYTDDVLPPAEIGVWSHPAKAGHVAIADLCNLAQNANACACKP